MNHDLEPREVIEPELLPPVSEKKERREERRQKSKSDWNAWTKSMAPILVGLLIDGVDFATMGPLGMKMGFIIGPLAAFAIGSMYKMPMKYRILFALGAAIYCTMPGTSKLPLGTVLGFLLRFKKA